MDGSYDSFYAASMHDFQRVRAAFLTKNGLADDQTEPETTDDLDAMYGDLAALMQEQPEQWH